MLQNKFEMPLDLAVKPSKIFRTYLIIISLFSLAGILLASGLPVILRFFLIVLLVMFIYYYLKYFKEASYLGIDSDGEWNLEIKNKKYSDVKLTGECIVTYFIIWLNFSVVNTKGKREVLHVLLLPDSSDKDLLRLLRVRLRFFLNDTKKAAAI